jgi:hypothetical protein
MLAHLEKPWLAYHVMSSMGADNLALFPSIGPCFHLVMKMKSDKEDSQKTLK